MNMFQNRTSKIIEIHNRTDIDIDTIVEIVLDLAKRKDYTLETVCFVILSLLDEGKSWENAIKEFDKYIPTLPAVGITFAEAEKGFKQLAKVLNENLNPIYSVIKIKLGDKVIRKDGLVGKVVEIVDNGNVTIEWDNGLIDLDLPPQSELYLIGKTVLGNKIDEEELQRQLDEQWDKCKVEQAKYDQLRKQLWYLKNRMVEDWYEKKQQADKEKAERKTEKGE